jgi:hypothetical protein
VLLSAALLTACVLVSTATPDVARAQIQTTGGTSDVYWVQEIDTTSNPPQIYYVPQGNLQDMTWSYQDSDCPPHPAGPPFSLGSYLQQKDYWQNAFQTIKQGDLGILGGHDTLSFNGYFADLPSIELPPGDTVIGVTEWKIHLDCLGNFDQEALRQVRIIRRVLPSGEPPPDGGSGGSSVPPAQPSAPPSPAPPAQKKTTTQAPTNAKRCKVPKLRGLTIKKATSKLKKAGCRYRFLGKGRVRSTDPKAGTTTTKRVTVKLKR